MVSFAAAIVANTIGNSPSIQGGNQACQLTLKSAHGSAGVAFAAARQSFAEEFDRTQTKGFCIELAHAGESSSYHQPKLRGKQAKLEESTMEARSP